MNSLEWINQEIRKTLQTYKAFKLDYDLFHRESDKRDYQKAQLKLKYLQQIKSELEAWEICKKHSYINNCDSNSNCFTITIWLNTANCDFKSCASFEECLKVKKALEVEE